MARKTVYLSGKIKWAKGLITPDEKFGNPNYNCVLILDESSKAVAERAGLKLAKDTDGDSYRPRRKVNRNSKNGPYVQEPPKVFDDTGDLDPLKVGNGSSVTVKLTVADTSFANKSINLEAVRVDELIEYIPADQIEAAESFTTPF